MSRYQLEALTVDDSHGWEVDLVPFLHSLRERAFVAFGSEASTRQVRDPDDAFRTLRVPCRKVEITTDERDVANAIHARFADHPAIAGIARTL